MIDNDWIYTTLLIQQIYEEAVQLFPIQITAAVLQSNKHVLSNCTSIVCYADLTVAYD